MRRCILLSFVAVFLLVLVGPLQAERWVQTGDKLIIDRGPITFGPDKKRQAIDFEVPAPYLENCNKVMLYVGVRKSVADGAFMCRFYLNGHPVGGGGNSGKGTSWDISGMPVGLTELTTGKNQIVLQAEEYGAGTKTTYNGQAGGVVLYFSKEKSEDIGLIDCINYSRAEDPKNKDVGPEKYDCWVFGNIHKHSDNSDGSNSIKASAKQSRDAGCAFALFNDHYEQIDKLVKAPGLYYNWETKLVKPAIGFANYVKSCKDETLNGHFVAVAGAELNTPWKLDDKTTCYAHTLCVGSIRKTDAIDAVQGKEGRQAEVIAAVREIGLAVAAHPNLTSLESVSLTPWEGTHFRFDLRSPEKYAGLNGVEIGNTVSPDQDEADMNFYMGLMKEHYPVFPTGGCDNHGWGDKEDAKRLRRLTGLFINGLLTESSLLTALKEGHVWASVENVKVTDSDPIPGFATQLLDRANFTFYLAGLPNKVTCQMFRNGEPIPGSKQVISPEISKYSWADENCPDTETWYNFRVLPNYLVTAPIIIRIGN